MIAKYIVSAKVNGVTKKVSVVAQDNYSAECKGIEKIMKKYRCSYKELSDFKTSKV